MRMIATCCSEGDLRNDEVASDDKRKAGRELRDRKTATVVSHFGEVDDLKLESIIIGVGVIHVPGLVVGRNVLRAFEIAFISSSVRLGKHGTERILLARERVITRSPVV